MEEYKGFRADRLREVMKEHGVTKDDIAKGLKEMYEVTPIDAINKDADAIINGQTGDLYLEELYAICKTCNCSSDYLIGLSDDVN